MPLERKLTQMGFQSSRSSVRKLLLYHVLGGWLLSPPLTF